MRSNKAMLITTLSMSIAPSVLESALWKNGEGQPTINGGRKKFKQNRRQQIKRKQ